MATKDDFTEDEWKALQQGVTGAGLLVSVSDRRFTESFPEASALAKNLGLHRDSESGVVRELARAHGTGFGMISSPNEVSRGTLAALRSSLATLEAKSPEDVEPYRRLVLDVVNAVAGARSGVTATETAAISAIREALGFEE